MLNQKTTIMNKKYLIIGIICLVVATALIIWLKKRREQREQDAFLKYVWTGETTPNTSFAQPTKQTEEDLKKLGYSSDEIASIMVSEAYKRGDKF